MGRLISKRKKVYLFVLTILAVLLAALLIFELYPLIRQRLWPDESAYNVIINEIAVRHHISPFLVKAVIKQESNFDPLAVGAAGERGLMQIMEPAVRDWEEANSRTCPHPGMLFSPRLNIEIGTWYLARGMRRWREYRDQEALALAEYNAGPSRARQWAPEDRNEEVLPRISFSGTRNYIEKVLDYKAAYEAEYQDRVRDLIDE